MALPIKSDKYSYKDYLACPKEESFEIIDGVPYAMSPAPSRIHQEISMRLINEIYTYLKGKSCKIYAASFDVRLCKKSENDEEIINVVQPDITVVCDDSKLDDKGVKGVPDFIIEIVSPSSVSLDYVKKLYLYGSYGVKEYWIVNPSNKTAFVYKILETGSYDAPCVYNENDKIKVGIFEDLTIDLSDVFR
ncbi:MAG: Uma2 family endonuclease [Bacillota bacterium]|nr:Uma2 family endonuclease [Bacillota bacterium]